MEAQTRRHLGNLLDSQTGDTDACSHSHLLVSHVTCHKLDISSTQIPSDLTHTQVMMHLKCILTLALVLAHALLNSDAASDFRYDDKDRGGFSNLNVGNSERKLVVNATRPAWWNRIKSSYKGNDLRLCKRTTAPPSGSACGREVRTCFFGTQTCSSVGPHPRKKCHCNGQVNRSGAWKCAQTSCPAPSTPAGVFRSSPGSPFKVQMNLLTPKVLQGYATKAGLKADLTQAVKFQLNSFIEEQASYGDRGEYGPVYTPGPPTINLPNVGSPSAERTTDSGTNNLVDESDLVKSDGRFVYAAYGDIVVIWNARTGELVANYTLPPIEKVTQQNTPPPTFTGPIFYQSKPVILGMSLAASRLVLYVQGYGEKIRSDQDFASAFSNAYDTRVIVLDSSSLPASIDVVTQEDIQGCFRDARSIGSDVHVVTTSYIDYYPITGRLRRWNREYQGLNSTEYKAKAVSIAAPLIDDFVARLLSDILVNGKAPAVPKISIWQSNLGKSANIVEQLYSGGAIQAYVQLTSFSVQDLAGNPTLSTAGAFTPSSWGYTYAVDGDLVFAAQGWNWSPWWRGSSQTTYLMGFKLDGASAAPAYLGSVDGYILSQYSLSVFEGHLRVAATVDTFWPVWQPVEDNSGSTTPPQPVSTTNNTVYVLKIPTGNETLLKTVTSIPDLGKPNERFTAVRFFGKICYTVTFLQKDPFYVLDLNPAGAKVLSELEISGFSSYIQSINAADTLLVTVGQEADADGRVLGVKISLFDATDAAKPIELQKFVAEEDSDVYSSSSVQWDFKAFRWLSLGDGVGILIIPLQIYSYNGSLKGNFDGFVAYDISLDGISERVTISHVASNQFYGCYYQAYLPDRSFVFNGDVTTMKGHSVVSTDLDTGTQRWKLDMPKPENKSDCVVWMF